MMWKLKWIYKYVHVYVEDKAHYITTIHKLK